MPTTGMSANSRAAASPGSPNAHTMAASQLAACFASASSTAWDAIAASARFSTYWVPNAAVTATMSVPSEAKRRASAAIDCVIASVMLGLINNIFMMGCHSGRPRARREGSSMFSQALIWMIDTSLAMFALFFLVLMIGASELGFRLGRWRAARRPMVEKEISSVGAITTGMIGLLAFTVGLTISFAQSRFEGRRMQVMEEANAIGTAWLQA